MTFTTNAAGLERQPDHERARQDDAPPYNRSGVPYGRCTYHGCTHFGWYPREHAWRCFDHKRTTSALDIEPKRA